MNVFLLLRDSAARYPVRLLVCDRGRDYTYAEILARSAALAAHLKKEGAAQGDRILVYLDNSVEYIVAYFAVLLMNCIIVPVNKNLTTEVIAFLVADAEPKFILTGALFGKRLADSKLAFPKDRIFNIECPLAAGDIEELLNGLTEDGELPALLLYTSGTTRMPKGVTLTHRNLLANTESIIAYLGLTERDSVLDIVNFGYSYGNSILLTHIKAGACLIIENRTAYPIKVIEHLAESRATGFSTVGSYLNILLKQASLQPEHLKHLKYMTFAGENTNYDDIAKLRALAPHLKVFVMYGQTEASARLSYLDPALLDQKAGSIGKGIPGVTLRVVREDGADAAPGELGEIIAAGGNIMQGYWKNPDETAAVLRDGWLFTGDLAVTDEDGFLFIKGRKDDIIKHLGHRISPMEIEAVLNSFDQVLESAAISITVNGLSAIKAYVVSKSGDIDLTALQDHCRKLLPSFKRPQYIEQIGQLPRSVTGKIKRSDLKNRT